MSLVFHIARILPKTTEIASLFYVLNAIVIVELLFAIEIKSMRFPEKVNAPEQATGRAIRAVEEQVQKRQSLESSEQKAQRDKFYKHLDAQRGVIFTGIEQAALKGESKFYPGTIPGFGQICDKIFDYGLGRFDEDMLNDWLYSRDLKHVFRAGDAGNSIEW